VTTELLPFSASLLINPWPISPPAPVMSTTDFRIAPPAATK
jgi:hypothetical protein